MSNEKLKKQANFFDKNSYKPNRNQEKVKQLNEIITINGGNLLPTPKQEEELWHLR